MHRKLLLFFFLLQAGALFAQLPYNLQPRTNQNYGKCAACIQYFNSMPSEIQFGLHVDENNNIILSTNSAKWFYNLINKGKDGIAVDVVLKSQFDCHSNIDISKSAVTLGTLLQPHYLKNLKKNSLINEQGFLLINLGPLPAEFIDKEYELNLVVIQSGIICLYHSFIDIERYKWDLLDMGLYTDTITYKARPRTGGKSGKNVRIYTKRVKFTIPFEKSKTTYSAEDIKPLYDTLNISDYIIKRISIRAYSSVEGNAEYNAKLQQGRAESIVKALQSYQSEQINYDISTSENWMEFYESIKGTEFDYLSSLTKQEIKEKLKDKDLAAKMEPLLEKQRKAVIEIDFEKRFEFEDLSDDELLAEFSKAVKSSDLKTAADIQKVIFQKIINKKSPAALMGKLEIPEREEFGVLLNSNTVYNYFLDEEDLVATYNEIKKLKELVPESKEVAYNYVALKFYIWLKSIEPVDYNAFKSEISDLRSKGIPAALVNRMMVNYNIILTEMYMYQGDYKKKDQTLKRIYYKYKSTQPSPSDLLSLAQYFVAYTKYDWAIKLLKPYITQVDVDEDLLFYYINLTIFDEDMIKKSQYKQILLNAIDINKERFCKMFNAIKDGGVSFQLLQYDILKSNYCQSCE